jgi:hypothetical protein
MAFFGIQPGFLTCTADVGVTLVVILLSLNLWVKTSKDKLLYLILKQQYVSNDFPFYPLKINEIY